MVDSSAGIWAVAPFNIVSLSSEGIAVIDGWLAAFSLSVSHFALVKGCIPWEAVCILAVLGETPPCKRNCITESITLPLINNAT